MKKIFFTSSIFLLTCPIFTFSQALTPDWEISLPGKISWMQVNDWGVLITACENGLYGVDPEDGKKLWELPSLTNVSEEGYQSIESTPLVLISDNGSTLRTLVVNRLNGEVVFDSEAEHIIKVLSQKLIPELSALLIAYENERCNGIALFNYLKAEKKWERPFEKVKDSPLKVQPVIDIDGNILYGAGKSLFRISGHTGEILWQKDTKKKLIDLFTDPEGHIVYAVSGTPSSTFYAAHGGGGANLASGTAGSFEIEALSLSNGISTWKKPVRYSKRKYSGVALGPSDFLLFHTFSANKIDYQTGNKFWAKEKMGSGGEISEGVFPLVNGLLYAVGDGAGRVYLNMVNDAGEPQWKRRPVINGGIIHMEQMGDKIFYISTMEINFINTHDGSLLWTGDKYLSAGDIPLSLARDNDGSYVMYIRGMLVKIMPDKQEWVKITSDFAFRGELPSGLRILPKGFLLTGNQNTMLIGPDGKIIYHKFFEAPEESFGAKLLLGTVSAAASFGSFAYGASAMGYGLAGALENKDDYAKKARKQAAVSSFSSDVAGGFGAAVQARFGEDVAANNYKLILTKTDKSIGFVKINVLTGEEEGKIVTDDRTPDFAIDGVGDKVFLKSATDRVACYGL